MKSLPIVLVFAIVVISLQCKKDDETGPAQLFTIVGDTIISREINDFGHEVTFDGEILVAMKTPLFSETGNAYSFEHGTNGWEVKDLVKENVTRLYFSGNTMVEFISSENGTAHLIFHERVNGGELLFKQKIATNNGEDAFGSGFDMSGDRMIIGATYGGAENWQEGNIDSGHVYIYRKTHGVWEIEDNFISPTPSRGDLFGSLVAIDGNYAFVGTPMKEGIHCFRFDGEHWIYWKKINCGHPVNMQLEGGKLVVLLQGWDIVEQVIAYNFEGETLEKAPIHLSWEDFDIGFMGKLTMNGEYFAFNAETDQETGKIVTYIMRYDGSAWKLHKKVVLPYIHKEYNVVYSGLALSKDWLAVGINPNYNHFGKVHMYPLN